jgi:hypothetical protein
VLAQVEAPEVLHAPKLPRLDGAAAPPHRPASLSLDCLLLLCCLPVFVLVKWWPLRETCTCTHFICEFSVGRLPSTN